MQWLALLALALGLATLVRWPTVPFLDLAPIDPNTPLHMLVGWDLGHGGDLGHIVSVGQPEGARIRLLALPMVLVAAVFDLILDDARSGFHVAVWLWVAGTGLAMAAFVRRLGGSGAVAMMAVCAAPFTVQTLGNGQFENVAYVTFALGWWAAMQGRPGLTAAAGALAGFCSPYQGIVFFLVLISTRRWKCVAAGAAGLGVAAVYFLGVLQGLDPSNMPAPPLDDQGAALAELVLGPVFSEASSPGQRSWLLLNRPEAQALGANWTFVPTFNSGFLGLGLLGAGGVGLWRERDRPGVKALVLAGAVCVVLALGKRLALAPGVETVLPMPWALSVWLPGVSKMQATQRFLTGPTFVLVLGAAWALRGRLAPLAVLIVAEGLWLAPVHWPAPVRPVLPLTLELPEEGNIAIWPGPPTLPGRYHQLTAVVLQRRTSWFQGPYGTQAADPGPDQGVFVEHRYQEDLLGRSVEQWFLDADPAAVLEFRATSDSLEARGLPLVLQDCEIAHCVWLPR